MKSKEVQNPLGKEKKDGHCDSSMKIAANPNNEKECSTKETAKKEKCDKKKGESDCSE